MIRIATSADLPAMLEIYAPYVRTTTYTFEYSVPTEETFHQRFSSITAQFPWLVWEENGQVLGYAYGSLPFERSAYAWCAEVSIYLSPDIQGKGIGKKLYTALEHILFLQGYRVIYAIITGENSHSIAFHEHMGYRSISLFPDCGFKFGRWLDVIWMEKRTNSVDLPTTPPAPWQTIVYNNEKLLDILANLSIS